MSGGKLIQHVTNHAFHGKHTINTLDGELDITSTHHQMMYPYILGEDGYTVVGWMEKPLSTVYLNGDDEEYTTLFKEAEIVKYHKTNCLCIQGHPEMMLTDLINMTKIRNVINKYLFNDGM